MSALEVIGRTWISTDAPELVLAMSDGSSVLIQWDLEYAHRKLFVAHFGCEFIPCTAGQTGIGDLELSGYVDEVYRAAKDDEAERMSDQSSEADTWEEHRGER